MEGYFLGVLVPFFFGFVSRFLVEGRKEGRLDRPGHRLRQFLYGLLCLRVPWRNCWGLGNLWKLRNLGMGESIECEKFRPNFHSQTGRGEWQMIGPGHRGTGVLCHAKMLIIPGNPFWGCPILPHIFVQEFTLQLEMLCLADPSRWDWSIACFFLQLSLQVWNHLFYTDSIGVT